MSWEEHGVREALEDFDVDQKNLWSHHAGDWLMAFLVRFLADPRSATDVGIDVTTPDYSARFAVVPLSTRYMVFHPGQREDLVVDPYRYLANDACDEHCRWLISHAVSYHVSTATNYNHSAKRAAVAIRRHVRSHKTAMLMLGMPHAHLRAGMRKRSPP